MSDPVELLVSEHDVITSATELVPEIEDFAISDPSFYRQVVRELIVFFRQYADGYHHIKEEEILFPLMAEGCDLIDEMLENHNEFRAAVASIEASLDADELSNAHQQLLRYCSELLDHIAAENSEVFEIARSMLDHAELERIYFRCIDADEELGLEQKVLLSDRVAQLAQQIKEHKRALEAQS